MQHYNMADSQPENHRDSDSFYRLQNAQYFGNAGGDQGFLNQGGSLLNNISASTSHGDRSYEDQNYYRPSCPAITSSAGYITGHNIAQNLPQYVYDNTKNFQRNYELCTKDWNDQSGSSRNGFHLSHNACDFQDYSSPMPQSQNTSVFVNTTKNSVPTNHLQTMDDISESSLLNIYGSSHSCSNGRHEYLTGNATLTDDYADNNYYQGQLPQSSHDHSQQIEGYFKETQHAQHLQQSVWPTQQVNQDQTQVHHPSLTQKQLHPSQTQDLNNSMQDNQQAYKFFSEQATPKRQLLSQNHRTYKHPIRQQEWNKTHNRHQDVTQMLNEDTTQETYQWKNQQRYLSQTEQQQQQQQHNLQPAQQRQQHQTEQQQRNETQQLQLCHPQQIQQNQIAQQHWTNPVQRCLQQNIYQSPNHFQTEATNLTPILKDKSFNQIQQRRMYQLNSSTPQSAHKNFFQQSHQTLLDSSYNLQNSSFDSATNNLRRRTLWTGEQKENMPKCKTVDFDLSNNSPATGHPSKNRLDSAAHKTKSFDNSFECNLDSRISASASSYNFQQEPGKSLNSGVSLGDILSSEHQEEAVMNCINQISVDALGDAADCNNQPSLKMKSHGKMFTCEICGEVFQFRSTLSRHRDRHLGTTKRYDCSTCERKFSDRSSLRKHLRVHTGEQPFECIICHTRFSQAGNFRRHERKCKKNIV